MGILTQNNNKKKQTQLRIYENISLYQYLNGHNLKKKKINKIDIVKLKWETSILWMNFIIHPQNGVSLININALKWFDAIRMWF